MPPEPFTLAFDTSAAHCAAALLCGDRVLGVRHEDMAKGQAERLMPMLQELLDDGGIGWSDLDLIAVGTGPGNFTGVRIAVAAARGLALALDIPAIGVTVLEAQAHGHLRPVISTLDARQGMIYLQAFGSDIGPLICDPASLPPIADIADPVCVGFQADQIAARFGGQAQAPLEPPAVAMARIARSRRAPGTPRPAPLYLRAADAAPARDNGPVILRPGDSAP